MFKHISIAKGNSKYRNRNLKLYNKIEKILRIDGYVISEIIFESECEDECYKKEIEIIGKIGLVNLCNLTKGGKGTNEFKKNYNNKNNNGVKLKRKKYHLTDQQREEKRRNMVLVQKKYGSYWLGKKLPTETKEKMSQTKKGKNFSDDHKLKISLSLRGKQSNRWGKKIEILKEKIQEQYNSGKTQTEMSVFFNCSRRTISKKLIEFGLK